jgi:hypothetical protein
MWWRGQNLDKPITDTSGTEWNFRVLHERQDSQYVQRIFFWDKKKRETGVIEFRGDQALHMRRIKDRIRKILSDPAYRAKHLCPIKFPVERYY